MNGRGAAQAGAVAGIALVLAQDIATGWYGYHTWQYAALLALGAGVVIGYAVPAARGRGGETGQGDVIALLGALVVIAAGLASGLLGPDTETVSRAPGTVAPLPDAGAAAFFPVAAAAAIARGDVHLIIRRRNGPPLDIAPGGRRFVGATALDSLPQLAANIEARDLRGNHLTITQPTNPAFLSPVLLFPGRVTVAGRSLPADDFAVPALGLHVKAVYFSREASVGTRLASSQPQAGLVFAVDSDAGEAIPGGVGFAPSGGSVTLGNVVLRPTVGTYPSLQLAAVPYPPALWLGCILYGCGLAWGTYVRRSGHPVSIPTKRNSATLPHPAPDKV